MKRRNDTKKAFAEYLRDELQPPSDWNTELFGKFPGTVSMIQKYFGYILDQKPNSEKAEAIELQYHLEQFNSLEKKIDYIDGRPRSIENFFKGQTVPYERNLNFIALVFDAPIKTLEEFVSYNNKHKIESEESKKRQGMQAKANSLKQDFIPLQSLPRSIALFLMIVILACIGFNYFHYGVSNSQSKSIKQRQPASFFPVDIENKLFVNKIKGIVTPIQDTGRNTELNFHTINIFNDKCIYNEGTWSFVTDVAGEDMNSQYGKPFNENIKTLYPILKGRTTLANQLMDIHFNINNRTGENLVFSSFLIKILNTYDANTEKAQYNLYTERSEEIRFEVVLTNRNIYSYTTDKKRIENNESLFCRLRIKGDTNCMNLIYKFRIICDLIDANGRHYTIQSDKDYFIGFVE